MEEGRLVKWMKNEGDQVKQGDVLAEVETDKAVMELVARGEGVLRKRLANEGDSKPVGPLIAVIAGADEDVESLAAEAGGPAAPAPAQTPAQEKPRTEAGPQPKAKPAQTPLRQAEGPAWPSSIPHAPEQSQGEASLPPQERERRSQGRWQPAVPPPQRGDGAKVRDREPVRSSPLARRLASEQGLELEGVQGSGPGGRIVKRDIEAAMSTEPAQTPAVRFTTRAETAREADYEDVALTQMRKTIARRLAESIGPIPTFYLTAEFDVERLVEMREAITELGEEFKISFNDILLKSVATALVQHPEVNAHWLGDHMRRFYRVHLGVAVAIEDGLITPVIFDADQKRLSEISREMKDLAQRARDRKLKPDEYTGATFTVSNLGMFGIDQFTAIINPPEGGILAVGAIEERPVLRDGEITARKHLRVTMSCDHRVIDGATGARFLQTLRRVIENPLMLVY
ncbi:MAG TPA: dihydrolipoamide acetyltransferase family protein, partial [Gemmatimonadaceae bacterium]|nr:dihydrolipoamide acetyltransferase family protein [Gemmatimonadaceae bacterium]